MNVETAQVEAVLGKIVEDLAAGLGAFTTALGVRARSPPRARPPSGPVPAAQNLGPELP